MGDSKEGKRKKDKHGDEEDRRREKKSKRARSRSRSRSRSPNERNDRNDRPKRRYWSNSPDKNVKRERKDQPEMKKEVPERKKKETDMLNTRTGGAYIPPARLRMMQAQITDKSSVAYQRLSWEALKKSLHGHINKINIGNIGVIIKQLLKENIVRGRGLLCRSVIQAQAASPTFTNVYAALVAAVNSRFPNIGELLLKRLVIQFKRGFKRNDKPICISSASFIAHLVNQRVAHEILALELLTLLVETPTDDSVEVAIAFLKECGQKLTEVSSKGVNAIFEMLRNILHEGQLDKRVQYMIEVMFQVWKDGFKDHPALIEELELVPEEEQFTHLLMLDDATDPQDILNVFKSDDKFEENEEKYNTLCKEILGSDAETDEDGSGESGSEGSDDEDGEEGEKKEMTIIDNTETNLVALRRTIYLTINSSLDFEECAHKLMKMQLKPGQEVELCHMFLDCCAEQRTYEKFYGLLAQRFCNINRIYIGPFEDIFKDSYSTAHRLDTNRLRNVSKFFAHLLFTDSIGWDVLECVKLNEEDTTSSSRIYIKILFQELAEYMGLKKLNDRLKDPTLQDAYSGVFPRDNPKNTRFSINFFTSIGLGGLTDELREHLKQMPKNVPPPITEIKLDSDSSSSSSSSSSSDSDSSSSDSNDSDEESSKKKKDKKKSKNDKNKDKSPKTPEEAPEAPKDTERWGHDGFYDQYGKDARRIDTRPARQERDKDNFAIPRDVRNDNNRNRNRYFDQRNQDPRERRRDEEEGRRNRDDDRRNDDRNADPRERRRDEDEGRRNRDDDRRNDDRNSDPRERRRDEDEGRKNRDDDRRNDDRNGDPRERRRDEDESRRNRDDRRDDDRNGDIRRRPDDFERERRRDREEERPRRDDKDRRERNEDDRGDKDRREKEREADAREGDSRRRRQDDNRSNKPEMDKNRDLSKSDDKRTKETVIDSSEEDSRRRQRERDDRNRVHEKERSRDDSGSKRDEKSKKDAEKDLSGEDPRRRQEEKENRIRYEKERSRDVDRPKSKKDERNKKNDSSDEEDTRSKRREKENRSEKEKDRERDESRSKRDKNKAESDSSDEDRNRKEKDRKKNKRNKDVERSKKERKRDESDSSEEETRSKRDKDKRRNKKKESDDGWDIRRADSVRREEAVGRYWEN